MIRYDTLLDAARRHFATVAASPSYTKPARELALQMSREAQEELDAYNKGEPQRELTPIFRQAPSWQEIDRAAVDALLTIASEPASRDERTPLAA